MHTYTYTQADLGGEYKERNIMSFGSCDNMKQEMSIMYMQINTGYTYIRYLWANIDDDDDKEEDR